MSWQDPIVADVRRTREELSARLNFDVAAIFADIRSRQSSAGERLVRLEHDETEQDDPPERPVGRVTKGGS